MLSVITLSVITLSVITLSVITLNVIMLNVIMLNVGAPFEHGLFTCFRFDRILTSLTLEALLALARKSRPGSNVIKLFTSVFTNIGNKLECLALAGFSILV